MSVAGWRLWGLRCLVPLWTGSLHPAPAAPGPCDGLPLATSAHTTANNQPITTFTLYSNARRRSPIDYGHALLCPRVLDCLPQLLDAESVLLALRFAREAGNPYLRVGYNSLGAYATINHLHFQVRWGPLHALYLTRGSLPCPPGRMHCLLLLRMLCGATRFHLTHPLSHNSPTHSSHNTRSPTTSTRRCRSSAPPRRR